MPGYLERSDRRCARISSSRRLRGKSATISASHLAESNFDRNGPRRAGQAWLKTTFVAQTFEVRRKRFVPGAKEVALTESGALKKAPAVANRMPGAAALKIVADDETGELERATILRAFGDVPNDFAEGLAGG